MKISNLLHSRKNNQPLYCYTNEEYKEYQDYIRQTFGTFTHVFQEIRSPDIRLDLLILPPTEEREYYTIITMGAGAYRMSIPKDMRIYNLQHGEYMLYLPKDWNIHSAKEEDYWPLGYLKHIARYPIHTNSWLSTGHTIHANKEKKPFAKNTKLNSFLIMPTLDTYTNESAKAYLSSSRKTINFYTLIPLYEEELQYKFQHGYAAFLELFPSTFNPIIDIHRESYIQAD